MIPFPVQQRDSNRLIEEFMLMANMAVAKRIYHCFPDVALLRRHPPPNAKLLAEVVGASRFHVDDDERRRRLEDSRSLETRDGKLFY